MTPTESINQDKSAIDQILNLEERDATQIMADLKKKTITILPWSGALEKEYNPKLHPVMTDKTYLDKVRPNGAGIDKACRITLDLQRLATKRMTEMMFAIPVNREYNIKREDQKGQEIKAVIESIYEKIGIDSLNIERGNKVFSSCECFTLMYLVEKPTKYGDHKSNYKLKCKTYSPKDGDSLYPLFDEYDDMIAMSIAYTRTEGTKTINYFDTYTDKRHIRWTDSGSSGVYEVDTDEDIVLAKIPGTYIYRSTPIWEDRSDNIFEMEWTLSRNGNYLKKNSKPVFAIFTNKDVKVGQEKDADNEWRTVQQYPENGKAQYITWEQAIDTLKFHIQTIRQDFFTSLQLPDLSYENMKTTPMSGESRKQLFVDCKLKVGDEKGSWIKALSREFNIIKAYIPLMFPEIKEADVEDIIAKQVITAYAIGDETEKLDNIIKKTGGKQIQSRRAAMEEAGIKDVDEQMKEIEAEDQQENQKMNVAFNEPTA